MEGWTQERCREVSEGCMPSQMSATSSSRSISIPRSNPRSIMSDGGGESSFLGDGGGVSMYQVPHHCYEATGNDIPGIDNVFIQYYFKSKVYNRRWWPMRIVKNICSFTDMMHELQIGRQ